MDLLKLAQDADSLNELARETSRPSAQFVETVSKVAQRLGLDPAPMLEGEGVEVHGLVFHVMHHGPAAPDTLTLLTRMGSVPADEPELMLRHLLEHAVCNPSPATGSYGILPGTDVVVLRTTVDLSRQAHPAAHVLEYIRELATQVEAINDMLQAGAKLATLSADGIAGADAHPAHAS